MWIEHKLPIVDQYTYFGVDTSKDCSWDARIAKIIGKGKTHVGKIDVTLTDSHLDHRINECVMSNVNMQEKYGKGTRTM